VNFLQKAIEWLGFGDPWVSRQDGTNFRTNTVTLADYDDAIAAGSGSVLGLATAWACVNLVAGTIGSLPLAVTRASRGGVDEEEWDHPLYRVLYESPNADQTSVDYMEFVAASVELHGNSYSEIERAANGRVIALGVPIPPESVKARRASSGDIEYEWTQNGVISRVPQSRMLHVRGFGGSPLGGMSTIAAGRKTFGMALAIDRAAAATFRNGVRASGILSTDKVLTAEQRALAEQLLLEKHQGAINTGTPFLLDNGVKWEALSINPDDAQMLESRAFSVEEVCRMFQVPPHLIGHTAGNTQLGSSIEQQTLAFQIFTLRRRLKRIEKSLEKQLLTPADRVRGLKIKFNLEGLLRGDSAARAQFYQMALQNGWMTINEVRKLEGLPPIEGGDIIRMQMQNVPITDLMGNGGGPPLEDAA
jgi:HK97 family phage portal protein